jgi:hypothetical protein
VVTLLVFAITGVGGLPPMTVLLVLVVVESGAADVK